MSEFFEQSVVPEPPLTKEASHISHIYYGRLKASKLFMKTNDIKNNRRLWEALRTISDCYRSLQCQRLSIEVFLNTVKEAKKKEVEIDRNLGDLISKAALTYLTLEHPEVSADAILKASEDNHPEVKEELLKVCQL